MRPEDMRGSQNIVIRKLGAENEGLKAHIVTLREAVLDLEEEVEQIRRFPALAKHLKTTKPAKGLGLAELDPDELERVAAGR